MAEHPNLKILLVCEESAGVQVLHAVQRTGNEIVAVLTSPPRTKGMSASVASIAERLGYETWPARLVKDPEFARLVRSQKVDILLNVHSVYVVCDEVLSAVRIGAFNMHPGPLPRYAGLNTVSWALYNGETEYGVTIHWMARAIDAGDIAYESAFPIEETDTPLTLMHKCVRHGVPLIATLLETAIVHPKAIPRLPQDLKERRYFSKGTPEGGYLCWNRSAYAIVNFIRACNYFPYRSPWGHPKVRWESGNIEVLDAARTYQRCDSAPATVGKCNESGVLVASADEWVLIRHMRIEGHPVEPDAVLIQGGRLDDGSEEKPAGKG